MAFLLLGCNHSRARPAPVLPGHHPILHLFRSSSLNLYVYDDGEVSGTDLRRGRKAKFAQLEPAVADGLRADSLRLPDFFPLESRDAKGAVCNEDETTVLSAFTSGGQEVVFEKTQNCRRFFARPADGNLAGAVFRFASFLHGWEDAVNAGQGR